VGKPVSHIFELAAGIVFVEENEHGPGVRLMKGSDEGK